MFLLGASSPESPPGLPSGPPTQAPPRVLLLDSPSSVFPPPTPRVLPGVFARPTAARPPARTAMRLSAHRREVGQPVPHPHRPAGRGPCCSAAPPHTLGWPRRRLCPPGSWPRAAALPRAGAATATAPALSALAPAPPPPAGPRAPGRVVARGGEVGVVPSGGGAWPKVL